MKTGSEVNPNLSHIKRSMRHYKHGNDANLWGHIWQVQCTQNLYPCNMLATKMKLYMQN